MDFDDINTSKLGTVSLPQLFQERRSPLCPGSPVVQRGPQWSQMQGSRAVQGPGVLTRRQAVPSWVAAECCGPRLV